MAFGTPEDETLEYYSEKARSLAERFRGGFAQMNSIFDNGLADGFGGRLELEALEQFTKHLPPRGRVLDAGCGIGHHLRYFLERDFQCEGFDGSPEVLYLAEQNIAPWLNSPCLKLWKADFRLLSPARETLDGIWANRVLIHLPPSGCQRAMQTFFSALKPGGILFVSFEALSNETFLSAPPSHDPSHTFVTYSERDDLSGPAKHIYRYPPLEFESLVRQSGFQPLAVGRDLEHLERMAILAKRI